MNDSGSLGERLAARLAARIAHDLNNVAAVFSGHLYLLRSEAEPLGEALEAMEKAARHLERLTRGLAAMGVLGAEKIEPFDANEVARSAAESLAASGGVELELDASLPPAFGRRWDLARALEALLSNAREASGPTQPIRLRTGREGSSLVFTIEDSGSGVPAEVRRRNFDPFVSTKGEKGRGIGVTLATAVAALHGGTLAIEDRPEGGTRAVLRIPLE